MNKIKKILACVDLSQYSLMTLEYAVELAKGSRAQIIVFNVINQIDTSGLAMTGGYFPGYLPSGTDLEGYLETLKKDRHEKIKAIIKENFLNDASMMSIKFERGTPFECILQAVETENIDLIVMANKGRRNISRVLFGSTAEKVFRHSPVPVISVRDKNEFKRK